MILINIISFTNVIANYILLIACFQGLKAKYEKGDIIMLYNFALAFTACSAAYFIGEAVSTRTRAWVPSVFVTAVVMLIGYWTVFPYNIVKDAGVIPFAPTIGIFLLVTHMGTNISLKQLANQWKTILIALSGLVGMSVLALTVGPMLMDRALIVAGLPPLAGGMVAATTMMEGAKAAGLEKAAVFAITMFFVQGFAGYPLTAICLQFEGRRLLKGMKDGTICKADTEELERAKKKFMPPLNGKYNTDVAVLLKLGAVSFIAFHLSKIPVLFIGNINALVLTLLLGVLATAVGFLDENALGKCHSTGIVVFFMMMYVFDGLKDCTPQMLMEIIGPMLILIGLGLAGMLVFVFIVSRIVHTSFLISMASALTALYGFPANAVITQNTCTALASNKEEEEFLLGHMMTPMLVGGFTTVTVASVIMAGMFVGMF